MRVEETKTVSEDAQSTSVRHRPIHGSFKSWLDRSILAEPLPHWSSPICNLSTRTKTAATLCTPAMASREDQSWPHQQGCKTCACARAAPQWDIGRPRLKAECRVPHCDTDGQCAQHSEPCVRPDACRGLWREWEGEWRCWRHVKARVDKVRGMDLHARALGCDVGQNFRSSMTR